MKYLVFLLTGLLTITLWKFSQIETAPKHTTWCFQAGDNVGRVEEYEKYLIIFDNATGDFLQAGPVELSNSIKLLFATVDCK